MHIAALVLGILSITSCSIPFIGIIMGVLAIIFGVMTKEDSGLGKAGFVTGIIGSALSLVVFMGLIALLG